MIIYTINYPIKLSDCFEVPPDKNIWNGDYKGKPDRERVAFNKLLIPTTDYAKKYCTYGLYLMFFFRAKATATNTSNVAYTNEKNDGWKVLAKERYNSFGTNDQLQDCYLVTINIENHEKLFRNNEKHKLQFIEKILSNKKHPKIEEIISLLPTSTKKSLQNEDWRSFNKTNTKAVEEHDHKFLIKKISHQKINEDA